MSDLIRNKPNLIIFTGIDCTGKSSIANYVGYNLNIPIKHMDKVKTMEEGKLLNYKTLADINSDMIMDRFYMEEVVYSQVYRNYKADYIKDLEEKIISKFNVLLVYTYASNSVIKERFDTRGEEFTLKKDIPILKEHYHNFLKTSLIDKRIIINTSYDLTEQDYKEVLRNIKYNLN